MVGQWQSQNLIPCPRSKSSENFTLIPLSGTAIYEITDTQAILSAIQENWRVRQRRVCGYTHIPMVLPSPIYQDDPFKIMSLATVDTVFCTSYDSGPYSQMML